jgi:dTDP-4-amino-4,6-dideoxygalactose transaminase
MNMLPFALPDIGQGEIDEVVRCLRGGWLTTGAKALHFENAFADFLGARHALAVSSATIASLLALAALGVGSGDEVVVPTWTFSGPAMMARHLGARVVLCDVDRGSFNMTPETLAAVMTTRTKVVMPTHFAGRPAPTAALRAIAVQAGAALVDDAAHAFPASDGSHWVGKQGARATFFSFYATKTLTNGEGGMIVTDDDALAEKLRPLRLHGMDHEAVDRHTNPANGWRYDIVAPGWKANLPDVLAAIGIAQLRRALALREARASIAAIYFRELRSVLIGPRPCAGHAWHLFPVLVPDRDRFIAAMAERGAQCSVHFVPLHRHSFWAEETAGQGPFPNADWLHEHEVSLPIYSRMTEAEVYRVVQAAPSVLTREAA